MRRPARRVTVREVLDLAQTIVERLGEVNKRLAALEWQVAERNAGVTDRRLQMLEQCVDALQDWAESWNDDVDGDEWKRGGV